MLGKHDFCSCAATRFRCIGKTDYANRASTEEWVGEWGLGSRKVHIKKEAGGPAG